MIEPAIITAGAALIGLRPVLRTFPRDKRTLAEKNWDWVMGPDLPPTCHYVGHEYTIDPDECDWCGEAKTVIFHGSPLTIYRPEGDWSIKSPQGGPEYWVRDHRIVPMGEAIGRIDRLKVPTTARLYKTGSLEVGDTDYGYQGTAGELLDNPSGVVRYYDHEGEKAGDQAWILTEKRTGRPGERYDTFACSWRHPRTPQAPSPRGTSSRHSGGHGVSEQIIYNGEGLPAAVVLRQTKYEQLRRKMEEA